MVGDQKATAHKAKAIIGLVLLLIAATWILMWHLPTEVVCDVSGWWPFEALWFQNLSVSEQMAGLRYTEADRCVFLAVRSMHSSYIALSVAAVLYVNRSDRMRPTQVPTTVVFSILVIVWLVFWDGFDDKVHGYRAWAAYRTYDSVNVLIAKSLIRMVSFYTFLMISLLLAIRFHNRTKTMGDE